MVEDKDKRTLPEVVLDILNEKLIRLKRYTDEQTLAGGKVATEGDETEEETNG